MNTAERADTQQAAINKSRELDPHLVRVARVRAGEYQVLGETGWWTVRVTAAGYTCDCPAGSHGWPACWHRASCYRLRLSQRSLKAAPPVDTRPAREASPKGDTAGFGPVNALSGKAAA